MRHLPILLLACLIALGITPWRVQPRACCGGAAMAQQDGTACMHCLHAAANAPGSCCAFVAAPRLAPVCTCAKPLPPMLLPGWGTQPELSAVSAPRLLDFLHADLAVPLRTSVAAVRRSDEARACGPPGGDPAWLALHRLLI